MRFIIRKEAPSWDCGRFYFSCEIFKSCLSLRDRFNLECHYRMMRTKKEHINSIKVSGLTCWRLPIKRKTWNRQFNAGRHKENWFGNCQNKDFFWLIWRNDIFFLGRYWWFLSWENSQVVLIDTIQNKRGFGLKLEFHQGQDFEGMMKV